MTKIHEPAYPVLPAELDEAELRTVYMPSCEASRAQGRSGSFSTSSVRRLRAY